MEIYSLFDDSSYEPIIMELSEDDSFVICEDTGDWILELDFNSQNKADKEANKRYSSINYTYYCLLKRILNIYVDVTVEKLKTNPQGQSHDLAYSLCFIMGCVNYNYISASNYFKKVEKFAATGIFNVKKGKVKILKVEGIHKKLEAAINAKIQVFFYPKDNQNEVKQFISSYGKVLPFDLYPVSTLEELGKILGIIKCHTNILKYIIAIIVFVGITLSIIVYGMNLNVNNNSKNSINNYNSTPQILITNDKNSTAAGAFQKEQSIPSFVTLLPASSTPENNDNSNLQQTTAAIKPLLSTTPISKATKNIAAKLTPIPTANVNLADLLNDYSNWESTGNCYLYSSTGRSLKKVPFISADLKKGDTVRLKTKKGIFPNTPKEYRTLDFYYKCISSNQPSDTSITVKVYCSNNILCANQSLKNIQNISGNSSWVYQSVKIPKSLDITGLEFFIGDLSSEETSTNTVNFAISDFYLY